MQDYLKSKLFSNNDIELLCRLRSKMTDLKANFSKKYSNNLQCSIDGCSLEESQEHLLTNCPSLSMHLKNRKHKVKYSDLFSNTKKQKEATKLFTELFNIRAKFYSL